jgi:transcriptional regulator GlxA family with amidase domain
LLQGQAWVQSQETIVSKRAPRNGLASACVRRAEEYIEAHAEQPLRLGEIAQAAGVPVRTLLDAFSRFREVSPMQHLRDVRLERVRNRLLAAGPGTRVTSVALDCGFVHLGRFSSLYQERFGESPSQTLARA